MVVFIELLLLTNLWIWGVHGFFQLSGLADNLNWLPEWIRKPLWDCPPCQSSVHGTISFLIFNDVPMEHTIPLWIAFVICLCGLNYIIKEWLYV